ncbi:MAG: Calx-beta domain-containing protein [Cyanobacteria bacterium P01_A01_bin.116]
MDGVIPPVELDAEGNYVSGGIAVNLEGDMAEILQQFLAPDGDGAVQTRVSDDGVNVFYRFDTSFGPGAGLTGGILQVFSLEDGDPAEGSSDPAAAGTGFLSNFSFILTDANASITLPVSDDIVQEEDQTFSYTLVDGDGYTVDAAQNSGTFTVTDGVTPATSPTVGVTSSETTLIEDEQTRTTITFTTDGDIPAEGLLVQLKGPVRSIAEFDVNGTNNTQPRDPEGELVVTGPVVTGGNIAGTDEVAGSVFFRITEATSSIDVAVFDDDIAEGTENFTFSLVDGEAYEVDAANSGFDITIEDEPIIVPDPVVSFTTSTDSLNEAEGTPITFNFSVEGEIPADGLVVRTADNFFPNPQLDFNLLDFSDPNVIDGIEFFAFEETGPGQFVIDWKITKPEAFIKVAVFDDNIAEADTSFTTGLLPGEGYTLNPEATTATVSVTDGVDGTGGPSVSLTADKTAVNEGDSLTLTFNVAGDIPDGGLEVVVDSETAGALGDFITTDEAGNPLLTFTGLSAAPAPNGDASGFIVNITESTATISLDIFDDGPGEGPETFDFQVLDGENYDVDAQAGGFAVTLNDEPVSGPPVVSFSTTSGTLSEADGSELVLNFSVAGDIPPEGITVNLEGDMAEILQQFLAPDGDGAVQTRVSDDGVNVFYRFDTSFGPGAGIEGGTLDVFSLEDGDPAEGSSDPAAAGAGFLSNFSFTITEANASITLPVSNDIVQEEDQTFSYTLVGGEGYEVDPAANSGTFTVTDGVVPATSPTVGVTSSETTLSEDDQTRTTITFTTDGDIPAEGLLVQLKGPVRSIAEFDVNGTNNTQPRDPEGELVVTGPVVTGGNIAGTDEVAGSVFFRITEATSSIDVAVFDDDIAEGTENFTFSLVDGEAYEVDAANSGFDITIEDESIAAPTLDIGLYDAQTDSLISTLTEGSELLLSDVLGKQLTIGALVPDDSALSGQVESAFLDLNNGQATRTENIEPYTLFGDFRGNFLGKNALFSVGDNSIVFDLYSQNRLRGDLLDTVTRNFTVVDDLADFPDLTIGLYDSRTDTLIKTLEQGTEILASEILGKQLTIGAFVPDDSPFSGAVESMFLDLNDGQATRTENIEPYTLFGDFSGNFLGRDSLLNEGANSIDFDLYSGNRLSGNLLSSVTRDFTVVDDLTGQDDLVVGLFDAENDSLITVLDGNTELQASDIAGKELSIGAFVPEESPFFNQAESMFLDLNDGQATRTENIEPYTLFGDFNGNVLGQSDLLQTGENNIEFDIYSQNRLRGELLGSVTRTITVVDDAI